VLYQRSKKKLNFLKSAAYRKFLTKRYFIERIAYNQFLILSPEILTNFTVAQLKKPNKLKNINYKRNLQLGLIKLAKFFLYIFKNNIIGLKIICSGK
jgi:hypothetical protein